MTDERPSSPMASLRLVLRLHRDGLLNDTAFVAARRLLRPAEAWFDWASRLLLLFGATLVLAGIIFFFAYNWNEMGKFLKFGLIELSIAGCVAAAFWRGLEKIGGKTLLLAAAVLTGVLLAVYGQIYQTGADSYELFRGWALLIIGWVAVAEFAALWFLWLLVVNTGAILFWVQVGDPGLNIRYEWLCLALAGINGTALLLSETGLRRGIAWLAGRWFRPMLLTAVLVALAVPTIHLIVSSTHSYDGPTGLTLLAAAIWALASAAGYLAYRYKLREMTPLALIVMNLAVILLTLIGKVLFHNNHSEAGTALFFALIIIGVASSAAYWLKQMHQAMLAETGRAAQ